MQPTDLSSYHNLKAESKRVNVHKQNNVSRLYVMTIVRRNGDIKKTEHWRFHFRHLKTAIALKKKISKSW